ncbi:MAG: glutamate--cysteine ligase [Candidatus Omnitrophica bacterium]|nr:glutamate--cysteine ligase [Candidatus Omnitrophota bacterium]
MTKEPPGRYGLFEVAGIELEYMLVRPDTMNPAPVVDEILRRVAGDYTTDHVSRGIGWSNELVNHVIEVRTENPVPSLDGLAARISGSVGEIARIAVELDARLLGSSMHPWMDPAREAQLWSREYSEIYATFDRIFGCRTHGWTNLQSCQLNLPFKDDAEFSRLHTAIRLLLPILPALASSSPLVEGRATGLMNNRIPAYRQNALKVPSVTGECIPEPVQSETEYREVILGTIYRDLKPYDPGGILRYEWVNARGAIARFDRSAIEIRLMDIQECPAADVAVCRAVMDAVRLLVEERFAPLKRQLAVSTGALVSILEACTHEAEEAGVHDREYLRVLGIASDTPVTAGAIWKHLLKASPAPSTDAALGDRERVMSILDHGVLSRRILQAIDGRADREAAREVWGRLGGCLSEGRMFDV